MLYNKNMATRASSSRGIAADQYSWQAKGRQTVADLIRVAAVGLGSAGAVDFSEIRRAGFDAVNVCVSGDKEFTTDALRTELLSVAESAVGCGGRVVSVSVAPGDRRIASSDRRVRGLAVEGVAELIGTVEAMGGSLLIVAPPRLAGDVSGGPVVGYRSVLNGMLVLLRSICPAAERWGIAVALRAPWGGCLLSPVEVCELIDLVNSPCVGVCVDVESVLSVGRMDDWVPALGHRAAAVWISADAVEPDRAVLAGVGGERGMAVIEGWNAVSGEP